MSRQQQDQLDEERSDLDAFLAFAWLEAERVENGENPPDFYVSIDGRRIAIEHTNFYRGGREQERRAAWEHLSSMIDERRKEEPILQHTLVTIHLRDPKRLKTMPPGGPPSVPT